MKSLYNEHFISNKDADKLIQEVKIVFEVMKKYVELGYSPREVSHVIQTAVAAEEAAITIMLAISKEKNSK